MFRQGELNMNMGYYADVQQALNNFDRQFDQNIQNILSAINLERQIMKKSFHTFLLENVQLQQGFGSSPIEPINQLFQHLQECLKQNQDNSQPVQPQLDFIYYLNKFQIKDFMVDILNKFSFNRNVYENQSFPFLIEEDRQKSIIVGQRDQSGNFTGRALIIYKTNPTAIYLGYMKNNQRHGAGILVLNRFQYYLGEYYENYEWGYGEMQFINSDQNPEKFVGYFSQGKRCGEGQSFIQNTQTNQEIRYSHVNIFNGFLHGPKVQETYTSTNIFQLNQYNKDYFSFKDQFSDKGVLRAIQVSTKGNLESQELNKCPPLQIDFVFYANHPQVYQQPSQNNLQITQHNKLILTNQFNNERWRSHFKIYINISHFYIISDSVLQMEIHFYKKNEVQNKLQIRIFYEGIEDFHKKLLKQTISEI